MGGGWLPEKFRGTTNDDRHHLSDIAATIADVGGTTNAKRAEMDGKNLFSGNHNDQLIISINPLAEVPWLSLDPQSQGTCAFSGDWKYVAVDLSSQHALFTNFSDDIKYLTGTQDLTDPGSNITNFDLDFYRCWKQNEEGEFKIGCLFNLADDPQEEINLWHDQPDIVAEIQAMINQEYFSFDYNSGQNMAMDPRSVSSNLPALVITAD